MQLGDGGVDIYYIDESADPNVFTMIGFAIPLLRKADGIWTFRWDDHLQGVRKWRRGLRQKHGIPVKKELHGVKLAAGRGRYRFGTQQFTRPAAAAVYRDILSSIDFLPESSIIAVAGTRNSNLYGATKLEATLHALLQRMRTATKRTARNGMVFFDEGHGEYRTLYRKSLVYLPTGSDRGNWGSGNPTQNLPMDNFTKDGNIKQSHADLFIQVADMLSYALALKVKSEIGALTPWQQQLNLGDLYSFVPRKYLNTKASRFDPMGIVRRA